jgi:predicted  nucleic acid-binding Zn-ribbon protein
MIEVTRFSQWCRATHKHLMSEEPKGEYVLAVDYDALQQQLATVTQERDDLRKDRDDAVDMREGSLMRIDDLKAQLATCEAQVWEFAEYIKNHIPECWAGPNPNKTEQAAVDWLKAHASRQGDI